ncbi:unnamed protein product [Blepharisma stoltei]|uniref:Centrosomal protein of 162 kDa n=1 Tax=Blepharisma stoltei TaxID=1481888 RepID=A0AAU9JRE3_9CILI|nr:unnamed protein product [Blepharisma stoltei]
MEYSYGSSSEELSDSQGLKNFLEASSSEEEKFFNKQNPYLDFKKKDNFFAGGGDPYAFNMDFSNIKVPSKAQPKPQPQPQPQPQTAKSAIKTPTTQAGKKGVSFEKSRPKSPEDDDRPIDMKSKQANSKFESMKKDFLSMVQSIKNEDSSSHSSKSSKNSDSPAMPTLNVVNWSDVKGQLKVTDEEKETSHKEIKTEPFRFGINPPISLNKKLDTPTQKKETFISPLDSEMSESYQSPRSDLKQKEELESQNSDYFIKDELQSSERSYKESNNTWKSYSEHEDSSKKVDTPFEISASQSGQKIDVPIKATPILSYAPKAELNSTTPQQLPTNSQPPYYAPKAELISAAPQQFPTNSQPPDNTSKAELISAAPQQFPANSQPPYYAPKADLISATPQQFPTNSQPPYYAPKAELIAQEKPPIYKYEPNIPLKSETDRPHSASDSRPKLSRERELEIEIIDLRGRVENLQSQLNIKQEQVDRLENLKSQWEKKQEQAYDIDLRGQVEYFQSQIKIMQEQLNHFENTEARVKDLEAENELLKSELGKKEKSHEERLRNSESRVSERIMRTLNMKFEYEKDEFDRKNKELEIEINQYKIDVTRCEAENRELRFKLSKLRDQEVKIKELEQKIYTLSRKNTPSEVKKPIEKDLPKDEKDLLLKEIETQEQLIKGYQKENERLVEEMKKLNSQIKEEQVKMHHENMKVDLLKTNLIKDHGGVLIKENISDFGTINELAGGTVINKQEYIELRERASRLTRELFEKEKIFTEKELEYQEIIEKLRRFQAEAEFRFSTTQEGLINIQEINKIHEKEINDLKEAYEEEIGNLQARIKWYVENQEFLEGQIKESKPLKQDLQNLQRELNERPATADMKKMKNLEEKCKGYEEGLKTNSSIAAMILASKPDPEQSELVISLKKRIQELEAMIMEKEIEQETRIRNLKQEYESVKQKLAKQKIPTGNKGKQAESVANLRIKELEKQLEDTRAYYTKKLRNPASKQEEDVSKLKMELSQRPSPKEVWAEPSPNPVDTLPEFKDLSDRDAKFLLLQSNKRIKELEDQIQTGNKAATTNFTTDHALSLKINTLEEELEKLNAKYEYSRNECEKLRLDKEMLETHIERTPVIPGTSEFLKLQRKIENLEDAHYRREQELINRLNSVSLRSENEIEEIKRKFQNEKAGLQKLIAKKNKEIDEFRIELEELLSEIERLRSRKAA